MALQPVAVTRKTPRRLFWDRFRQDKAALVGGVVIAVLIFIAFFGGPIATHITGHPQNTTYSNMTDAYGVPLGPNRQFWFGADAAGRDLFVRTMYGARTSLFVGIVASGLAVLIGTIVGLTAGFAGGWVDSGLSRFADVLLAVPQILIAVGIVAACSTSKDGCLGGLIQPGLSVVIAVITLFSWSYIARIVRGYTLSLREKEFVESARAAGASNLRIVRSEILPNLIGAADRLHDAPDPDQHLVRGSTLLPRARCSRRSSVLGIHSQRRVAVVQRRLVAHAFPGRIPDHHNARLQPPRRRSP